MLFVGASRPSELPGVGKIEDSSAWATDLHLAEMLRSFCWCAVVLLGFVGVVETSAQQTGVDKGVFYDRELHFSYPWPVGFAAYDPNAIAANLHRAPANRNESLVFAAKDPNGPYGVVLLAERLGTDRKPPLAKPDDFIDAMIRTFPPSFAQTAKRSHGVNAAGIYLTRMDWQDSGGFESGVVFQAGPQLLVLKFNAPSAEALDQMVSTTKNIKRLP